MRRDDFVARYGGDEFAMVLRDIDLPTARDVAERGMATLRGLEINNSDLAEPIRITASMGIARLRSGEVASSWIERADRARIRRRIAGATGLRWIRSTSTRPKKRAVGIPYESTQSPRGDSIQILWKSVWIRRLRLATSGSRPYATAPQEALPGVVPSYGEEVPDQPR